MYSEIVMHYLEINMNTYIQILIYLKLVLEFQQYIMSSECLSYVRLIVTHKNVGMLEKTVIKQREPIT